MAKRKTIEKVLCLSIFLLMVQMSFAQVKTLKAAGGGTLYTGGGSSYIKVTFNTPTSNYTLVLADSVKQINMNVASANTVTVPLNSTVAFSSGTVITVFQYGAGKTTITPAVGVTIRSAGARYSLYEQYSSAILTKIGTNEWLLVGDLNF